MNSNRGQYNSTPLYDLKNNRRAEEKKQTAQGGAPIVKKRYGALSVVLSIVLPVLFLAALLVPNNILRWVFLASAAVSVLAMWLLRAFVKSARSTLTVIYAALAVVIGLALFINRQPPETRNVSSNRASQAASLFSNPDAGSVNAMLNELATEAPTEEEQTAEATSEAQARLQGFFAAWGQKSATEMLPYCLPSWVAQQASPEGALFGMLFLSYPTEYEVEDISGSDGNSSRIITLKAIFDESGNPVVKRMHVMMMKINDVWYVNPDSLDGVIVDEAAEAAAAANVQMISTTVAPTATPAPEGSTLIVYFNEDGGKYYHLNKTCPSVRSEYWPLTGKIPFELINSETYKHLIPCERCAAPTRPPITR
ncbi:MAG: hypothetical protein Q4G00_12685 [Clostridia bacterium]|nr:hypothetical protein [Clostridia bacterium]